MVRTMNPLGNANIVSSNKYDLKCLLNSAVCVLTSTKILIGISDSKTDYCNQYFHKHSVCQLKVLSKLFTLLEYFSQQW